MTPTVQLKAMNLTKQGLTSRGRIPTHNLEEIKETTCKCTGYLSLTSTKIPTTNLSKSSSSLNTLPSFTWVQ